MIPNPKIVVAGGAVLLIACFAWMQRNEPRKVPVGEPSVAGDEAPAPHAPVALILPTTTATVAVAKTVPARAANTAAPFAEHDRFTAWTARFLTADAAARPSLVAEGTALATARRPALARLIASDPRAALAAAVPMAVRAQLPAAVTAFLEERISGLGELAVFVDESPAGHGALRRAALIGRREFDAYVHGRRDRDTSLARTSLVGIAVDRALAVSESRFRVLESDEAAPTGSPFLAEPCAAHPNERAARPTAAFVESAGEILRVCCADQLAALEAQLLALEEHHTEAASTADTPGSSDVIGRPTAAWTTGTKKLLVIRVDFPDLPGGPGTGPEAGREDAIVAVVNDPDGVGDFYTANSFGKSTVQLAPSVAGDSPDVTPVLRMPQSAASYAGSGDNTLLHSDARAAAATAGFAVADYDRVAVLFANVTLLPGSRINYLGLANLGGRNLWLNGAWAFKVVAHELGHTYGLMHSSAWRTKDGDPVSPDGEWIEYGDLVDVMGDGLYHVCHFNERQKSILRWIPDTAVAAPTSDGVLRIHRLDAQAADLTLARAAKVSRDGTRDYWFGYRRAIDSPGISDGLSVHSASVGSGQVAALDVGSSYNALLGPVLPLGGTFTDPAAGVSLSPLAQGGTGADEWMEVLVDFAPFQPRVKWSRPLWYFDEHGGRATLTVSRTTSAAGAVSIDYATAAGSAVAPANFAPLSGRLTWADGDTRDKTITLALVPDAELEGLETFTVTLSNPSGAVLVGRVATTVTIADPGTRDPSLKLNYTTPSLEKILTLPDGSALVAGGFINAPTGGASDFNRRGVARFLPSGLPDIGFAGGLSAFAVPGPLGSRGTVYDLARQPDGKILAVGDFTLFTGIARAGILRLRADGMLDATFDPGSGVDAAIRAVLVQPDGRIVIGGEFTTYRGVARKHLARLNADGTLDPTFAGPDFAAVTGERVETLALQPDGKLLVGGLFAFGGTPLRAGLCRLLPSGAVDSAFSELREGAHLVGDASAPRVVHALAVQPDGRILVGGEFSAFNGTARGGLVRLESTGAIDPTFIATTDGACHSLALQPDGRILVGGAFTQVNGTARGNLARLTNSGAIDPAFNAGGYAGVVTAFAALPDGRVLFGGGSAAFQGDTTKRVVWSVFSATSDAPMITASPRSKAVGLGSSVDFAVTASGAPQLSYQWLRNGAPIAGATSDRFTVATAQFSDAGNYSVRVSNPNGTVLSEVAQLDVRARQLRMIGISTRAQVGTGGDIQIGGFAISGATPKRVVIRANGPALSAYGVAGALADPVLSLYSGQTLLQQNDNWSAADAAEFTRLGIAPWTAGSADAALVTTLDPGLYTAHVSGKAGATGIALIEIYDAEGDTAVGRLTGISTRSLVGSGGALLIGGFAIDGDVPKRVLIRASGPALQQFGVSGVLADPVLTIYSVQTAIAANDNWGAELSGEFAQAGMFEWAVGSKDAALAVTLPPGPYTAQVAGKNGATGVALIEIYED